MSFCRYWRQRRKICKMTIKTILVMMTTMKKWLSLIIIAQKKKQKWWFSRIIVVRAKAKMMMIRKSWLSLGKRESEAYQCQWVWDAPPVPLPCSSLECRLATKREKQPKICPKLLAIYHEERNSKDNPHLSGCFALLWNAAQQTGKKCPGLHKTWEQKVMRQITSLFRI